MENEIKVNEYVRMIDGLIAKIVTKDKDDHFILDRYYAGGRHLTEIEVKNDIVKHSNNLIDIIEEGDYVNGEIVDKIFNPRFLSFGELPYIITANNKYEPQEIEEIVTKEMMKSISYKVERED